MRPGCGPALELWAQVLCRPEPGLASEVSGAVTELNDQHAYLRLDEGTALAPGDLVCLGISHPCTTLGKWRVIPVVSDDGRVTDTLHAFF